MDPIRQHQLMVSLVFFLEFFDTPSILHSLCLTCDAARRQVTLIHV